MPVIAGGQSHSAPPCAFQEGYHFHPLVANIAHGLTLHATIMENERISPDKYAAVFIDQHQLLCWQVVKNLTVLLLLLLKKKERKQFNQLK